MPKSLQEIESMFARAQQNLQRRAPVVLLRETTTLFGNMQRRIFNQTQTASGRQFGAYRSYYWRKVRESYGRQTAKRDFQHSGNLFQAFKYGLAADNQLAIGFTGGRYDNSYRRWTRPKKARTRATANIDVAIFDVARGLENLVRDDVFIPSDTELTEFENRVADEFFDIIFGKK